MLSDIMPEGAKKKKKIMVNGYGNNKLHLKYDINLLTNYVNNQPIIFAHAQ